MVSIVVGGEEDFNSVLYGAQKHPGTVEYLRNQVYSMGQQFGGMMTEAAQSFMARAQNAFEAVNGHEAIRRAKAAIGRASAVFQTDMIRALTTIPEMQQACLIMKRYIMTEPSVRDLFQKQRCDGFEGEYLDMSPGDIGETHHDWRRVMTGQVSLFVNEDGEEDNKVTHYLDEELGEDIPLTLEEQNSIRHTWHYVREAVLRKKDDPSSSFGGML